MMAAQRDRVQNSVGVRKKERLKNQNKGIRKD